MTDTGCPCGSGEPYAGCCQPLHDGADAATPGRLMRARYAAHARGHADYLFRTWHPRTRPAGLDADLARADAPTWTGLEVLAEDGDCVSFRAHYRTASGPGTLAERSRFERRAGRWVYVGPVPATDPG